VRKPEKLTKNMTNSEMRDLPGQRVAYWTLFTEKIGTDQRSLGVTAPDGTFYRFERGESLSFVQLSDVPGERVAVITESDGSESLFESCADSGEGEH
jgi:hypothetical protein